MANIPYQKYSTSYHTSYKVADNSGILKLNKFVSKVYQVPKNSTYAVVF